MLQQSDHCESLIGRDEKEATVAYLIHRLSTSRGTEENLEIFRIEVNLLSKICLEVRKIDK